MMGIGEIFHITTSYSNLSSDLTLTNIKSHGLPDQKKNYIKIKKKERLRSQS